MVLLGGCYGVAMVFAHGVAMVLLGGCYGVAIGVARLLLCCRLLWCC